MTSVGKLKDRARKYEQKEDWKAAIDAYRKVLETEEAEDEVELELALFNRVGDLYLRLGQTDEAVRYYETAADKYAESGFFNNAIALCNKGLRHRPDRASLYRKLSRFCHEQGFLTDARRWIIGYAEREGMRGNLDAALAGLEEFAQVSGDPDVRELLAEHLASQDRKAEAVDQLRLAYAEWRQRGEEQAAERVAESARQLDPDADLELDASAAVAGIEGLPGLDEPDALDFERRPETHEPGGEPAAGVGLEGLETHRVEPVAGEAEHDVDPESEHAHEGESAHEVDPEADQLGGLETFTRGEPEVEPEVDDPEIDEFDFDEFDEPEPEPLPFLDTGFDQEDEDLPAELPFLDTDAVDELEPSAERDEPEPEEEREPAEAEEETEPLPAPDFSGDSEPASYEPEVGSAEEGELADVGLEPMDLDLSGFGLGGSALSPPSELDAGGHERDVDVDAVLDRAKELVSRGLTGEAARELRLLSATEAPPSIFRQGLSVANEIIRHHPDDLSVLQRRVEFASRIDDRGLMVGTYMDLAQALDRSGAETKARAMYQRVLGLDPEHEAARAALGDAAVEGDAAVDLDAILRELDEETGATPGGLALEMDETFANMLSQFKARVSDKDAAEDAGDHYDLGLAFKEMGLIDEAIGEFQTALTGGEERLKVYEELGQCFVLKGQYTVAIKILKRALQAPRQDDSDLLGVYYRLGQCHEELGQRAEAREAYERVLRIDSAFADVPSRVSRL
jgi:tetratricopeptide (TPR) repeat protein